MTEDAYATGLKMTLTEIKKICPDIKSSFIFTKDGVIVAGDSEASASIKKALHSFQAIREKAAAIGGIQALSVDGVEGNIRISQANEMYLATVTSKGADPKYLQTVTGVIVPTVLKLLKNIIEAPTPLKIAPPQQLTAKKITGFFAGNSAEIDRKILREWSKFFNGKTINLIEIQAPNGMTTRCKVKAIDDERLEGKNFIRIPEKIFKNLRVKEEAPVKVKPIIP